MDAYFIFAIVLTVAYVLYYAVVIAHDLYGKKGTDKPEEEVFDVGTSEEEESVTVTESETGFNIGGESYETETTADTPGASPEEGGTEKPDTAQEKLERLKAEANKADYHARLAEAMALFAAGDYMLPPPLTLTTHAPVPAD